MRNSPEQTQAFLWSTWFPLMALASLVSADVSMEVDLSRLPVGELRRFWTSTGLSPICARSEASEFLLATDEQLNLALIGALPNRAITQVRIHWLLDLLSVVGYDENGDLMFDYRDLDKLFDYLQSFGLAPGFELMGNPSGIFSDFENTTTALLWQKMVQNIAERYIERYGLENVLKWRFELWNEPDLAMYNVLNFTLKGYVSYAEASWRGLQAASTGLHLGGPAGLFKARARHRLCWGLLDHCARSAACPLSFITFHRKGGGSADHVLESGVRLVQRLRARYPSLRHLPVANDEADPLTGWWRSEPWREDTRYAAMVARVVVLHQDVMVRREEVPLQLLSNDNGFLSFYPHFFSQRTLTARFQMNNTSPPHVQFFLKPVYVVMALMSLLEDTQLMVAVDPPDSRLTVMATTSSAGRPWNFAGLLTFCNNTQAGGAGVNITISLRHLPSADARYRVLQLDSHTGPAEVWRKAGAPNFPDRELRQQMRAAQGPLETAAGEAGESLTLNVRLSLPGVALLQVCSMTTPPPGQVQALRAINVTRSEVLLVWGDQLVRTRCLRTYEVEFSKQVAPPHFHRLNLENLHLLSYHYAAPLPQTRRSSDPAAGIYRVRAVDLWGRAGLYSIPLLYPDLEVAQRL